MADRMFARILDTNTMTWRYPSGKGVAVPDELMPPLSRRADGSTYVSGLDLFVYLINRDRHAQVNATKDPS